MAGATGGLLCTDLVDPSEREAYWHHVLADTFAPVHLEGWSDSANPSARLVGTRSGRLLFAEIEATPQVHRRTPRQIRQADGTYFQIAIVTKGLASLQQDGRTADMAPGDFVVYENTRPFTWTFSDPWAVAVLSMPSDAVRLTDAERRTITARRLDGHDGLSGVVARFVLDVIRHASSISETQSERVLAQASDLAIAMLTDSANPTHGAAAHRTIMARIKGYIDQRYRDPSLTPEDIAAAVNISTRYLHKLFEGEHHTVALYLRSVRLQGSRDELLDSRYSHRGIAAIAHGCGFGDLSGFNRAFKAAYGLNPSELRRRGRATRASS